MSTQPNSVNPLAYIGVTPATPAPVTFQNRAPTTDDVKNFRLSTIWLDKSTDNVYMLVDNSGGVATWAVLGGSTGDLSTLTMPDLTVVSPVSANINFLNGSGIAITGSGDDVTFTATAPPIVVAWSVIVAASKTIVVNEGYFANNAGGVAFTLPAASVVGDVFYISGINAGGWSVAQGAAQNIRLGNQITTTGAGGSLASTDIGDSIFAVCSVANTSWVILSSMGNITIV